MLCSAGFHMPLCTAERRACALSDHASLQIHSFLILLCSGQQPACLVWSKEEEAEEQTTAKLLGRSPVPKHHVFHPQGWFVPPSLAAWASETRSLGVGLEISEDISPRASFPRVTLLFCLYLLAGPLVLPPACCCAAGLPARGGQLMRAGRSLGMSLKHREKWERRSVNYGGLGPAGTVALS